MDTYTITYTNGSTSTFTVTNGAPGEQGPQGNPGTPGSNGNDGRGIVSIAKTSEAGNVDTYTITYTDATTSTFTITNGEDGEDGFSPIVTAEGSGSNVLIHVTDANGTTTYTIPTSSGEITQLPSDWNATSGVQMILNKPTLATVATTGSYNDLANKPSIPEPASDGQLTVKRNGDVVGTFTANQAGNTVVNIEVPTQTSQLDNNSGFITSAALPTVNDGTLTIKQDGSTLGTFSANQGSNQEVNITSPTVNNATLTIKQDGVVKGTFSANQSTDKEVDIVSPAIPTVNDATLTIKQDGSTLGTFTANQASDQTIEITSPEYQILSISNDTIFLTNGGFVKLTWDNISGKPAFSTVAFTNEYGDLSNKPTSLSEFSNEPGYITLGEVPVQQQADWTESDPTSYAHIKNKPEIPAAQVNADWEATSGVAQILNKPEIPAAQVNADWAEVDVESKAYIQNKPDLSAFITSSDLSNYVTKTEDETIDGDKTFEGDVTLNGNNVVSATGSLEVPSVLENVGVDGTLNLSTSTGTGNCEQTVNFCDLQTVYDNMLAKFNALNDQIDNLLDSIKDLNKQLKTPKDGEACPNTPTVTDIDGNTYSTVRIGNQCWTRENLRTTKLPNGTAITFNSGSNTGASYYTNPAGGASAVSVQGYLYNFHAATNGVIAGGDNIQGVCPVGWRLPSDADWEELKTYVSNQNEFKCGNSSSYISKALSSPLYWPANNGACTPGNNPEANNATGFSMVPATNSTWADIWSSDVNEWGFSNSYSTLGRWGANEAAFYSVRCIRSNSNGENNTVNAPAVETIDSIRDITQNSAWILGGAITDNGGMPISQYGVIVGTSASVTLPTATAKRFLSSNPSIPYTMSGWNITGLSTNTQYYYRAYAINAIDTAYGEAIAFHTVEDGQPCPGLATVTDIDGNTYNTVMIGSQCWLKENLKVTKYADNTPITMSANASNTEPYYKDPVMNAANGAGYLYNWAAVMGGASSSSANPSGVRGICPVGWHVPSDDEFAALGAYVGSKVGYLCDGGNAKALAATIGWEISSTACAPGNNQGNNNVTGFYAIENTSGYADFWTATQGNFYIPYDNFNLLLDDLSSKGNFYGVRCVKDPGTTALSAKLPTVEIESVDDPNDPAYQKRVTAIVSNDGGDAITSRRIYYSKTPHPSPSNYTGYTGFTDSNPVDCIIKSNLEAGTTYYFRAAAQNSVGWAYSDEYNFTTDTAGGAGMKCPGTPSVTDKSGYSYSTVQIGTQCWMARNLRTTKYADGSSVTSYIPNGAGSVNVNYGRLYPYTSVMNGSSTSTGDVQGVCPSGWHVPSEAEFLALNTYVGSQNDYTCNSNQENVAKALATNNTSSDYLWESSAVDCAVGNGVSTNNATGFNAYPAGYYVGSYDKFKKDAWFMTTTMIGGGSTRAYYISYSKTSLSAGQFSSGSASVRCIKGATPPSVKTSESVTNIGKNGATVGGTLMSDGINDTFDASSVTEFGVCYSSTSENPLISDSKKTKTPAALGSFTLDLTGLQMGTTYYYRAYATNANGTQYGEVKSFSTLKGATVSNYAVTSITKTSARVRGMITANQDTVISWGFFLYKKNSSGNFVQVMDAYHANTDQFTTSGYTVKLVSTPKTGVYSMDISGLEEGATYKYKAEIRTIFQGWVYAPAQSAEFTTLAAPEVSTEGYTYTGGGTTSATYTMKGKVTRMGNPAYTKRGFVWCKSNNPSTYVAEPTLRSGEHSYSTIVANAADTGAYSFNTFTANTPSVTYRFRAYAINNSDTVYGDVVSFTSPTTATMSFTGDYESSSKYSANVTQTSIKLKTYFSSTGGSSLSSRGVLYTTNESLSSNTPTDGTISMNASDAASKWVKVASASATTQEVTISGLSANTTYYIRSYGTNSAGTAYSSTVRKVKTALNCGQTLTDQNGHTYSTIKIGTQCWMRGNLRAENYDNVIDFSTSGAGTAITLQTGSPSTTSDALKYRYNPNNSSSNVNSYGFLYNWSAATGYGVNNVTSSYPDMTTSQGKNQGVCPRGWHIPTSAELTTLRNSLTNDNSKYTYFNQSAGKMLYTGYYSEFGSFLNLWSSTEYNTYYSWGTYIDYTHRNTGDASPAKKEALSVRCVQD